MNILHSLAKIIVTPLIAILGFAGYNVVPETNLGASLPQAVAVFETSLQSAITSSATSMTLTSNSVRGGSTLSGYNCFTIDEGSSQAEYVCGTVSGTTVSSLTRGIDPVTATTTNATLQFAHRRGANVKITDFPIIQIIRNQLNGSDNFSNILYYNQNNTFSSSTQIVSKGYVDGVAISGAPNADESTKGIVELATQIEMASSTNLGGTSASLVLQSRYATSSPYGTGLYIPITRNDGKLNPNFIATTSSDVYNWGGKQNFNANASTTGISAGYGYFGGTATTSISSTGVLTLATTTVGVLQTNSSGIVYASGLPRYTYATTSIGVNAVTNGYATSTGGFTIPSNTITASSTIQFKGNFNCDNSSNGDRNCRIYLKKSTGETLTVIDVDSDNASNINYGFDIMVSNNSGSGSTSWAGIGSAINYGAFKGISTNGGASVNTTNTMDLSTGATFVVVLQSTGTNTQTVVVNYSIVVNP